MTDPATATSTPAEPRGSGGRMQIGVVAEQLGLSVRTVHYWEEVGLVTPSARTAGGFRLYTEDDVARLTVIRRMKPLGFTLEEMREVLTAFETLHAGTAPPEVLAAADDTIATCRTRVAERRAEFHKLIGWADEFDDLLQRKTLPPRPGAGATSLTP
jgi:MerR family transcriptional regulator, copper efflux regulator